MNQQLVQKTFVDFFAGIGLVEKGMADGGWEHLLSIDYSEIKARVYHANFGKSNNGKYLVEDVFKVSGADIPDCFLAHASFPCTDVSSAGARSGSQDGKESSAIDSFLRALHEMGERRPSLVMLENVKGLLTSHKGRDLRFLVQHLNKLGYLVDLLCIDARSFVPQSRERVFVIGHHIGHGTGPGLAPQKIEKLAPTPAREASVVNFIKENSDLGWIIQALPSLPTLSASLVDIVDKDNEDWWEKSRTDYLCSQMFERHFNWIQERKKYSEFTYATAFRRMRERDGKKQSTAELRTDGIAGCLRTAKGGSAKQILVRAGKGKVDARLLSPSECALLMGVNDFLIPEDISVTDALFCFGDAVCVDVVKWIDSNYLTPCFEKYSKEVRSVPIQKKTNIENKLSKCDLDFIDKIFDEWCVKHNDKKYNLPYKERLYGGLIVLSNLEKHNWKYEELDQASSTDEGVFFSKHSLKNHTPHRISLILSEHNEKHLNSNGSQGEQGRTSAATKVAGLDFIKIVSNSLDELYNNAEDNLDEIGGAITLHLYSKLFEKLQAYYELGGIDIPYQCKPPLKSGKR